MEANFCPHCGAGTRHLCPDMGDDDNDTLDVDTSWGLLTLRSWKCNKCNQNFILA